MQIQVHLHKHHLHPTFQETLTSLTSPKMPKILFLLPMGPCLESEHPLVFPRLASPVFTGGSPDVTGLLHQLRPRRKAGRRNGLPTFCPRARPFLHHRMTSQSLYDYKQSPTNHLPKGNVRRHPDMTPAGAPGGREAPRTTGSRAQGPAVGTPGIGTPTASNPSR